MIFSEKEPAIVKKNWLNCLMLAVFVAMTAKVAYAEQEELAYVTGEATYYSQRFIGKRTTSGRTI